MKLRTTWFVVLSFLLLAFFIADLLLGSLSVPLSEIWASIKGESRNVVYNNILFQFRIPKALTALAAGITLSLSGLQMQTIFRNPLAGPYILGISAGASLGVALVMLGFSGVVAASASVFVGQWTLVLAAWLGAMAILSIILFVSLRIRDIMTILILGMMLSGAISAVVNILQYFSNESLLKSFVVWTMGSLSGISQDDVKILYLALIPALILSVITIKPLNALLLGEKYARSMGVNINQTRTLVFISTSILTGTITAFCGPIGFIGTAVPHVCRFLFKTANHAVLVPACIIVGGITMLISDIVSQLPGSELTIPINSVTALIGIPIIIWIIVRNQKAIV
jgi:iron complex transport system permease protein